MSLWAFRLLTFLAAFLLFGIQPLTGKEILPIIGGAPHGWLVALAFFQTTLLAGYVLVHWTRKLSNITAGALFGILMAAGILLFSPQMPFTPPADSQEFSLSLFAWLWQTRGPIMIAMGAMAPMTQRLFTSLHPDNPYRLYALSNAGSFLGLLAYPFFIEPFTGLSLQVTAWKAGACIIVVLLAACTWFAGRAMQRPIKDDTVSQVHVRDIFLWLVLSAVPASMLSSVSALINQDIASFPLLWVLPLALYLGTYIAAFTGWVGEARLRNATSYYGTAIAIIVGIYVFGAIQASPLPGVFLLLAFTAGCYLCHERLYRLRPAPERLTLFYLTLAAGGAIGGCLNAFVAPVVFNATHEFYLSALLSLLVLATGGMVTPRLRQITLFALSVCLAVAGVVGFAPKILAFAGAIVIFACFAILAMRPYFLLAGFVACIIFGTPLVFSQENQLLQTRNFFGVLRVLETYDGAVRTFVHGKTIHGRQLQAQDQRLELLSYYNRKGPLGIVMDHVPAGHIAVVGLGSGQMVCYQSARRKLTFYEIDPDVVSIARTYFTFLDDCGPSPVILGDARLMLQKTNDVYKGIVLDAFTSDAIPTHLVTREAIALYRQRLAPDGFLLFHISNRHLDLKGPLMALAQDIGWQGMALKSEGLLKENDNDASEWFVMTPDDTLTKRLKNAGWTSSKPASRVWTDDRFSLLNAMHL